MAALPYIQLYVADYLADTIHLTAEEHGAYLLLIMNYWQTGKPIPASRIQAASKVPSERWTDVERTLNEYFLIDEQGSWTHERIEEDLAKVREKSAKASAAGKKSAQKRTKTTKSRNKRSTDDEQPLSERSTSAERTLNHTDTDTDTDTEVIKTKEKKINSKKPQIELPDWIPAELWADYLVVRKAKKTHPMEAPALLRTVKAIEKAVDTGYSVDFVLGKMIANGWRSFKVGWLDEGELIKTPDKALVSGDPFDNPVFSPTSSQEVVSEQ